MGALVRELIGRRLDVALTFCLEPTPGLARRVYSHERMHVLMRRGHRLSPAESVQLEQLRGDRFVVPAEDLSPGFNRRLRALCSEHGFEPATSVATVIWDDDEWPAGRRRRHAGQRGLGAPRPRPPAHASRSSRSCACPSRSSGERTTTRPC